MKKVAIYPGSFNPFHEGHYDVVNQALKSFDKVIIVQMYNVAKNTPHEFTLGKFITDKSLVEMDTWNGLLVDYINHYNRYNNDLICCVIKGLRNAQDFEYEKVQQYYNEDLDIKVPTFYVISNRKVTHVSSSAIRTLEKFRKE